MGANQEVEEFDQEYTSYISELINFSVFSYISSLTLFMGAISILSEYVLVHCCC